MFSILKRLRRSNTCNALHPQATSHPRGWLGFRYCPTAHATPTIPTDRATSVIAREAAAAIAAEARTVGVNDVVVE